MNNQPVGIFDSGIGGVSVLRAIHELLPAEDLVYFGDAAHLPYGEKSLEQIRAYSKSITEFLMRKNCKAIVIACNTASAAALKQLRTDFPGFPFIGMEPAVKPAAEQTQTGVVGVIATTATFQGELFASVVERFANGVEVLRQPCPGLVQQIEAGKLDDQETEQMLRGWIEPMLVKNIDALVLGCTHYPFVRKTIEKITGPTVRVIDPAPAIARQLQRVLESQHLDADSGRKGNVEYYTSGSTDAFLNTLRTLTGESGNVMHAEWNNSVLQ
ncbi:MAG: glutamate racemase [Bacteroidia bacterium]